MTLFWRQKLQRRADFERRGNCAEYRRRGNYADGEGKDENFYKMKKDLKSIANFIFEAGILAKTPRSGFSFLGSGNQSVAEHTNRAVYIGIMLSELIKKKINKEKVIMMCLFHDFAEARVSDLNYVHQRYVQKNEEKAMKDAMENIPGGERILKIVNEYNKGKTIESKIVKDADQLELLAFLKEQIDIGNSQAEEWIPYILKRLKTDEAKTLAEAIMETRFSDWWFQKDDSLWVKGDKN